MKLTFIGAAHEVTGSCSLIEVGSIKGLVDCGMEQGKDLYENVEIPVQQQPQQRPQPQQSRQLKQRQKKQQKKQQQKQRAQMQI